MNFSNYTQPYTTKPYISFLPCNHRLAGSYVLGEDNRGSTLKGVRELQSIDSCLLLIDSCLQSIDRYFAPGHSFIHSLSFSTSSHIWVVVRSCFPLLPATHNHVVQRPSVFLPVPKCLWYDPNDAHLHIYQIQISWPSVTPTNLVKRTNETHWKTSSLMNSSLWQLINHYLRRPRMNGH